jgi:uncharacterized membrane protein YeaQ/YmgE (transglycosylase-associated protein family)
MSAWEWMTGDDGARALAGLAGASVSAALDWNGLLPTTRKVFIGFVSAYYLGPAGAPIVEWAMSGLKMEPSPTASGFLMGLVGMTFLEIIVKAFKLKRDEMGAGQ